MATDEELLIKIQTDLDWTEENTHKPGTCGACCYFNLQIGGHGPDDGPGRGDCNGWDDNEDDIRFQQWVEASSTCERYHEDTAMLEAHKQTREDTEKAHLAIMKRYREPTQEWIFLGPGEPSDATNS